MKDAQMEKKTTILVTKTTQTKTFSIQVESLF